MRLVDMKAVNLRLFDFDYDLTWAGFFMNANGHVFGRFGGRDESDAEANLSLGGLKYAMNQALLAHGRDPEARPIVDLSPPERAEEYAAFGKLQEQDCVHCHMVYDFRRADALAENRWDLDSVWVYPPPKNVGLTLNVERGDRVAEVAEESAAGKAGLRAGDVLRTVGDTPIASFADVQYALHNAPDEGRIPTVWERDGRKHSGTLQLAEGWRESDISWRASMWTIPPAAAVYGTNLTAEEKRELGLGPKRLAFRQGQFVSSAARKAGIEGGDIILGMNGEELELTMLEFNVHVRLSCQVGDRVTYNVVRDGKRLDLPIVLEATPF